MVASVKNIHEELGVPLWKSQIIHLLWKQYKDTLISIETLRTQVENLLDAHEGFFGWEYVNQGSNKKSPAFYYLNSGDTYSATLLITLGNVSKMTISTYGDQVEEGSYA